MTEYKFEGFNLARDIAYQTAVERGWWEAQREALVMIDGTKQMGFTERSFGDLIALVHSEASEALEYHRKGYNPVDQRWEYQNAPGGARVEKVLWDEGGDIMVRPYGQEKSVRLTPQNAEGYGFIAEPVGIPTELADIIIRVLDMCGYYGIDIEAAILAKARYNDSRPHRHGGKVL